MSIAIGIHYKSFIFLYLKIKVMVITTRVENLRDFISTAHEGIPC
ncbi:hypothetical protein H710_00032 [Bartonella bacilliformis Ver097]|uniref:Uncharacterized protein n=1 Tax=Bartonella bacilliformis Ver097 TaxID=1293911 RepID=A0A072R7B6_BARBA|nr:hypothetical protein H710_00032 [Bartonella bacilliformis Ver097]